MMQLQISLLNNTLAHMQLSVVWLAHDQAPCVICTPQTQPPLRGKTEYVLCTAVGGPQGLAAAAVRVPSGPLAAGATGWGLGECRVQYMRVCVGLSDRKGWECTTPLPACHNLPTYLISAACHITQYVHSVHSRQMTGGLHTTAKCNAKGEEPVTARNYFEAKHNCTGKYMMGSLARAGSEV